jgi:chemotaxis protein methyltransferase CheR
MSGLTQAERLTSPIDRGTAVPLAAAHDLPASDRLSERNFRRLAELIQGYSGIKMPATKRTMLEGRLRRRLRVLGVETLQGYCDFLFEEDGLQSELIHLMDAVTTNKTDFFREPAHFQFLQTKALAEFAERGRRDVKAWSAACSVGAEPYSLAMVLEENRRVRPNQDYSILCTDLCTEVLGQAVRGEYPKAMIEPVELELRRRYILSAKDARSDAVRVAPRLRAKLSFARLNLMDEAYPVGRDMDVIFCRNILIYFDKATQNKVLSRLCDHLRPGGYLFIGHSETIVGLNLPVVQVANTIFRRG